MISNRFLGLVWVRFKRGVCPAILTPLKYALLFNRALLSRDGPDTKGKCAVGSGHNFCQQPFAMANYGELLLKFMVRRKTVDPKMSTPHA